MKKFNIYIYTLLVLYLRHIYLFISPQNSLLVQTFNDKKYCIGLLVSAN